MAQKKYISLSKLSTFLDNLKTTFASIIHKHTLSDITDYKVDSDLSSTSTNPVQNKVINAEFDAVSEAMGALETAIDGKSDISHNHDDRYYTESEINTKVATINDSISNIETGATVVAKANHAVNADIATSATSAEKAIQDGSGNVIKDTYETKSDAVAKLSEAKSYADDIKNDLLNNAGTAYDTLKELGDLIDDNTDAIDALEVVAASKANASDLTSHTSNKNNPHEVTLSQLGVTATIDELNILNGVTTTTTELNILDGVTATATEINKLDGLTATTTELNYVNGVTSSIQTQLDNKAAKTHDHGTNYVSTSSQTLTDAQKSNVRSNIGAAESGHTHTASDVGAYTKEETEALIVSKIEESWTSAIGGAY